jgi:hypothetical protein
MSLSGHRQLLVCAAAHSSKGGRIASGDMGGTVMYWDLRFVMITTLAAAATAFKCDRLAAQDAEEPWVGGLSGHAVAGALCWH